MREGLYQYSCRSTTASIVTGLAKARSEGNIYVVANLVALIWNRRLDVPVRLTVEERYTLLRNLKMARYHKVLPLAEWIPRGYQIARLLRLVKIHCPSECRISARDIFLIKKARIKLLREKNKWLSHQIKSLDETCGSLGIKHKISRR